MLKKDNRLRDEREIARVFKLGRVVRRDFIFLKFFCDPARKQLPSRFAFTISGRYSKKATARNYLKRRLREAVRRNLPESASGVEGVFFLDKNFTQKEQAKIYYSVLEEKVVWLLRRAGC